MEKMMKRTLLALMTAAMLAAPASAGFRTPVRCVVYRVVGNPCCCYCPITPVRTVASAVVHAVAPCDNKECDCTDCKCKNCNCGPKVKPPCPECKPVEKAPAKKTSNEA